jgi:hypothetical protein
MYTTSSHRRMPLGRPSILWACFGIALTACQSDTNAPVKEPPPDPAPADPVQLTPGSTYGREVFSSGDTPTGGQGQVVDGVESIGVVKHHYHAHLSLFVNGERIAIPLGIGIVNGVVQNGIEERGNGFLYSFHTHDATGLIHMHAPTLDGEYTLGQFFDLWGEPLGAGEVAGFQGELSVFVDGVRYEGDVREIVLKPFRHVSLQIGRPLAPPPMYLFPGQGDSATVSR